MRYTYTVGYNHIQHKFLNADWDQEVPEIKNSVSPIYSSSILNRKLYDVVSGCITLKLNLQYEACSLLVKSVTPKD